MDGRKTFRNAYTEIVRDVLNKLLARRIHGNVLSWNGTYAQYMVNVGNCLTDQ